MKIETRRNAVAFRVKLTRNAVAFRVKLTKIVFAAACLFFGKTVLAQHSPEHADHDYLVDRCVERARADASDVDLAFARAKCERLQRQIDSINTPFALGDSWKLAEGCGKDASICTSDRTVSGKTRADNTDMLSQPSRLNHMFNAGSHKNECIGLNCMAEMSPQSQWQYDPSEMQRRFRNSTVNGSDYLADLLYPGFGRFERRRQDVDIRLDFLNPHRCGKLARVGMCLSLTMR